MAHRNHFFAGTEDRVSLVAGHDDADGPPLPRSTAQDAAPPSERREPNPLLGAAIVVLRP
jgi:hypothetical protein